VNAPIRKPGFTKGGKSFAAATARALADYNRTDGKPAKQTVATKTSPGGKTIAQIAAEIVAKVKAKSLAAKAKRNSKGPKFKVSTQKNSINAARVMQNLGRNSR